MNSLIYAFCLAVACLCSGLATVRAADDASREVKLLTLNVWNEGKHVEGGYAKIIDVLAACEADIVAFSEVRNYNGVDWPAKVAESLAARDPETVWHTAFHGGDVGIISRYPIESGEAVFDAAKPQDAGSLIAYRLTLPDGLRLTVCVAHLDYRSYGLNLIRGYHGGTPDFSMIDADGDGQPDRVSDVKAILEYNRKSKRNEAVRAFIRFAQKEKTNGRVVILAGDFNEGSHLDWTKRARRSFGHYGVAIDWDTSADLARAGFADAYRTLLPDEIAHPGFTWPAPADGKKTTTWTPRSDERDRLDYIYYPEKTAVGFKPVAVWMVGPRAQFVNEDKVPYPGKENFVCDSMPWPTDHNGVMVRFTWKSAVKD